MVHASNTVLRVSLKLPLIVTLLLLEHTKAPPDEYSAVFLLNITVEYCCMMTLLSENAAALPQSAVLLMNVMKEYPENMVLTSLKVQIAPAKGS